MKNNPFEITEHNIESMIAVSWGDSKLSSVLDIHSTDQNGFTGPQFLTCDGVEFVKVLEEAIGDRTDMFDLDNHVPVFSKLRGFTVSKTNRFLDALKHGDSFGEYAHHAAKHYLVLSPYNCLEFVSFSNPVLAGYNAR